MQHHRQLLAPPAADRVAKQVRTTEQTEETDLRKEKKKHTVWSLTWGTSHTYTGERL